MTWNVEIGGVSVDALQDVETGDDDDGTLGTARITAANTSANRGVDYSQEASVYRHGELVYEGPVTKKPSLGQSNERIEFTVADKRAELKYIETHRPYYQMDPGDIVREAVQQASRIKSPVEVFSGSSASGWSANTPEFGTVGAQDEQLQDRGSDILALGFPTGSSGTYQAVYSGVPSSAIPGSGQIVRLTTRVLANSRGGQFEGEVELNDNGGNTYVWRFPRLSTEWDTYSFSAEDAQPTSTFSGESIHGEPGTLVYRFRLKGSLGDNRAIALDYADVLPFTLSSREASVEVGEVQDVGTVISRRFDQNVMEMLADLGEEFGYTSFVDPDDVLHFEPAGSQSSPLNISYDSTPVFEVEVDRDADKVVNKVTVQGGEDSRGNPIQVTASDSASIQFYGLSEREEQIVDENLQTERDARRKAEGFLADNAWDDQAVSFRVADGAYRDVRVGQSIGVHWPPDDLQNEQFTVSGKEQHQDGSVTLDMTGGQV